LGNAGTTVLRKAAAIKGRLEMIQQKEAGARDYFPPRWKRYHERMVSSMKNPFPMGGFR
jgi:hypothetical protein